MRFVLWSVIVASVVAPAFAQAPAPPWPRSHPTSWIDLAYPPVALAARVTGRIVVRVTNDSDGRVVAAESLSGPAPLVAPVLANVKQWTLPPGARTTVVVYLFEIDPGACHDDTRSLFRLVQPNLAIITACTAAGRPFPSPPASDLYFASLGTPVYPPIAQSARVSGLVVLEVSIDRKGSVASVTSLTEPSLLTQTALTFAKAWRFHPDGGKRGIIVLEFSMDGRACDLNRETTSLFRITADY